MLGDRNALLEDEFLTGAAWCRAHSDLVDAWLTDLLTEAGAGHAEGLGLAAVGGYRRSELAARVAARHERVGEVAFRLEPDLKEGRGGLRDVHSLRWAEAAHRVLLEFDAPGLDAWSAVLLDARVELQRQSGHPSNVLALQ